MSLQYVTIHDVCCSAGKWSKVEVKDALEALEEKGLTRAMSEGLYIRQHSVDTQVKLRPIYCSTQLITSAIKLDA